MSVHPYAQADLLGNGLNPHYLDYLVTLRPTRPYLPVGYTDAMEEDTFSKWAVFQHSRVSERRGACERRWLLCEISGKVLDHGGRAVILVPEWTSTLWFRWMRCLDTCAATAEENPCKGL